MTDSTSSRVLFVNADDFGQSEGVNEGIIEAHERGIVTSASLMVRWPAAGPAGAYARHRPQLSVGLHLDLGEWAFRDGIWVPLYEVVETNDRNAVALEVQRQLAAFATLVGQSPTHIDSHQHVHRQEPIRSVVQEVAQRLDVTLRHFSPRVHYCGDFYGQANNGVSNPGGISVEGLLELLQRLPNGITELCCHPGYATDLDSMYRREREIEVRALCDPSVPMELERSGILLRNFHALTSRSKCTTGT